jgi:hypothetical protein
MLESRTFSVRQALALAEYGESVIDADKVGVVMEHQERRFDKDMKEVEFRPRSYRGQNQGSEYARNRGRTTF